ncbi:uncharacterized protein [Clytia hemisphaerica]|uniref:uncharacterized protein n=1 Tax=Clytia hemisphaerica TaxID=252671 RepID=UPI0034D76C0F
MLVSRKLADIKKLDPIKTRHDPAKILRTITGMIKVLRDLISLAEQHKIENQLYYGDCLDQVYQLLDDTRLDKWLATICEEEITEKQKWSNLIIFLEKDVKLLQQKQLIKLPTNKDDKDGKSKSGKSGYGSHHVPPSQDPEPACYFCDGKCPSEHIQTRGPWGKMVTQYFACKQFVDNTPRERLSTLKRKGLCFQCLLPGAKLSEGKHRDGRCQYEFVCKHPSHSSWTVKKHVLVCDDHKDTDDNQTLLQRFKDKFINRNQQLPTFVKEIKVSFHTDCHINAMPSDNVHHSSPGIYLLQQILVNNQKFTVFFDNGCSDFIIRKSAVNRLGSYATQIFSGSVNIGGVGGTSTQSSHGIYLVNLPLHDGDMIPMRGICLDQITQTFPVYPLTPAISDLQRAFSATGDVSKLPSLPQSIGGDVDIMIGVRYLNVHPKLIFQMSTGLSLFESVFNGPDGRGVLGGPHSSFDEIHKKHYNTLFNLRLPMLTYFASLSFIGHGNDKFDINPEVQSHHMFDLAEKTGLQEPRCNREYQHQRRGGATPHCQVDSHINEETNIITAKLPFTHNPDVKLAPNKDKALKVYQQQLRKLNRKENLKDKEDIINSEKKLQNLVFVDYVRNLPNDIQRQLQTQTKHFIPWRAVWKPGSVSTPCRVVFDASSQTSTGFSLNDIIAKGRNNMNLLQEIAIRFLIHRAAFTTDVSKMYNTVKLCEEHWCYQRYVWQEELDPQRIPEEKVIKTLIYGVRSAGNQSEYALREIARLSQDLYPEASKIILNDTYVDDCVSGENSIELARQRSQELEQVVNKGGFKLKGIVISGEDPPETMSEDQQSVTVAGMKWFPKQDVISLNIGEMNFAPKRRGKKSASSTNIIPDKLTRRHCASKVGEVFDLLGRVTPITAQFKLDLHDLVIQKFDWDDVLPDHLRKLWINNFEMMQEINQLKYQRTIVPPDAINLEVETLDFADASQSLVCVTIYTRFKRQSGTYSSQLFLSRSRIVPEGMSQPRAELYAALLNSHTGEVVRKSLENWHQSAIKFCDSQIVLHWLSNDKKTLKQWVRSRVIESLRFTQSNQWFYVQSDHMIADIGTRRGPSIPDVNNDSRWFKGDPWMKLNYSEMPIVKISDIKMSF